MELSSDEELVAQARQGCIAAFEVLVQRHERRAFAAACHLMGNPDDASDALQDALIRAYKNLHSFRGCAAFSTWLYRIVTNTCLDALRRRRRALARSTKEGTALVDQLMARTIDTPEVTAVRRETLDSMYAAIARLPASVRLSVVLRDLKGLSYLEIAQFIDCPLSTAKTRVHRGRMILRVLLANYRSRGLRLESASR